MPTHTATLETKPLDPIGVEVLGLDLSRDIDDARFAELRSVIMDEGLVLFRCQPLEDSLHEALGMRLGRNDDFLREDGSNEPVVVPISNVDAEGKVLPLDHFDMRTLEINEQWHTDSSFREVPASFSLFASVVAPPEGGDTFFASMCRGWEELDEDTREELYGVYAVHDYATAFRHVIGETPPYIEDGEPVRHPIVREHPETGRIGLYVTDHACALEGFPRAEGRAKIESLVDWCTREGRVYRHHWEAGDLIIWDNRSMLHRAQGFDGRQPRVLKQVRIAGQEPPIPAPRPANKPG